HHGTGEPARLSARGLAGTFGPREESALCATLSWALSSGRRNRCLRPQLVQPRRRRDRDGVLLEGTVPGIPGELSQIRRIRREYGNHLNQVLAGGWAGGATPTL